MDPLWRLVASVTGGADTQVEVVGVRAEPCLPKGATPNCSCRVAALVAQLTIRGRG